MILQVENWYFGYAQLLKDCRSKGEDGGSVLLCCPLDVDAMAAARILSYMLRTDGVTHVVQPCVSYQHLEQILDPSNQDEQGEDIGEPSSYSSIVLLNMGATRNLTRLLSSSNTKIYVLDGQRPVHLANLHDEDRIVVFFENASGEDIPSDGDNLSGRADSSSSSSSSDDDDSSTEASDQDGSDLDEGEAEFEDDEDGKDKSLGVETASTGSSSSAEEQQPHNDGPAPFEDDPLDYDGEDERENNDPRDDDDDDSVKSSSEDKGGQGETAPTATGTTQATAASQRLQQHEDRRARIQAYYNNHGLYYGGAPVSFMALSLSKQIGKTGNDQATQNMILWLACVGVTYAYWTGRLTVANYSDLVLSLRHDCNITSSSLNELTGNTSAATNTIYAEHLISGGNGSSDQQQERLTKIGFSENGRVLCETDLKFFLLRQTTLIDAMQYSDYVSTKLQLHTRRGMMKLHELLAQMGFRLDECNQPFVFMKPQLRRRLQEQVQEHAPAYGLDEMEFTSFFRVTGYQSLLSASDTAYAVMALLACDTVSTNSQNASEEVRKQEHDEMVRKFNIAFDALNSNATSTPTTSLVGLHHGLYDEDGVVGGNNMSNYVSGATTLSHNTHTGTMNTTGLSAGLAMAMQLQKVIMGQAASLIERSAITLLSHFRYAYVTCTNTIGAQDGASGKATSSDEQKHQHHIFAQPLVLSRLAQYLMDVHRENNKWTGAKARPLVLMAEKPRTNTFVVIGYLADVSTEAGTGGSSASIPNEFRRHFELAAESMPTGTFYFDSFYDSNVVEVAADDVQRFIEQLHYTMDYTA